ncbi:MAG: molecular chaperone GrpE [Candidatus Paceibacteria bacterium]|jgi:molecular chaperone GrpE
MPDEENNNDIEQEIAKEEAVMDQEADVSDFEFDDTEGVSGDKIKQLKQEVKDLKEKVRENLDGWQRERADFINYKKSENDRGIRMRGMLEEAITTEFLATLDNFDMAMSNKEVWESIDENWRIGVEHIYKQFSGTLEGYGMKELEVKVGDKFDPERHMGLNQVETDDSSLDETIAKVIQRGYEMKDTILRPAKVEVYKLQN